MVPSTRCFPRTSSRKSPSPRRPCRARRGISRNGSRPSRPAIPTKAMSNFDYAGRLTETVLAGCGRPQGGHRHRVGSGRDEGQERPVGRSVHPARLPQGFLDPRLIAPLRRTPGGHGSPGVRRRSAPPIFELGSKCLAQYESAETTSPPATVPRALQIWYAIVFLIACTLPSANRAFTTPG